MHIVVIHQYYLLPGRSGGSRFNEFARLWTQAGHQVTVLAGSLDYATGAVPEAYRGRLVTTERDGLATVHRCWVPSSYGKGYLGRAGAFAGFALASSWAGLVKVRAPDVVIATSPPLTATVPGFLAARLRWRRVPWVFEMRDLWPESAVTTGVLREGSGLTRALYGLERGAARLATRVNVLTPAFREDIVRRGLVTEDRVVFIPNGADVALFTPSARDNEVRRELGWGDRFVVLYAGAHGRANAIMQLVDAAERLKHRPDILLASVGDGPERQACEAEASRRGLANITFHGSQPKDRMPLFVAACDVGAAVLQDNPTFRTVYPNKVFDYMAGERPTLLAIDGVARSLVCEEARAGVFARPEDPEDLARVIVTLEADRGEGRAMGARGRAWVLANATRESLAARYLSVLESLVAP
ncbi:MAG: glycosyltransferase family 4 protein [Deltaproteobacteria bacterium]|nr:glycosyltransferase family 4 protein [Deltaproteobacteria bacterium]